MRSLLFLLFASTTIFAAPVLILFQDSAILMESLSVSGTETISVPQGWDVMDVIGAKSWYVVSEKEPSWEEIIKGKTVKAVDEPPSQFEVISTSPLVLKKDTKYYIYNSALKKWLVLEYEEPQIGRKLVMNGQGKVTLLLRSSGSWNVRYYLFEDTLTGNAFLSVSGVESADVFLISRPAGETSIWKGMYLSVSASREMPEEHESEEVKVYHLGKLKDLDKSPVVNLIETNLSDADEYYSYSFAVNDSSFDYQKTTFTRSFKTPVDLPGGTVSIFSNISGVDIMIGETSIPDTPKNSLLELPVTDSWDVRVRGEILDERNYKDTYEYERTWRVTVQNLNETESKVRINVYGNMLRLLRFSIKPLKETSDQLAFELIVPANSEKEFEFTMRSGW
ncbi:conserved hypothetical protein [Thermotoga petrophila RKU-10]|uniref:DUF4139 domain-containing protein n=2 Tax=Thermotoga petrophila TaxID=93929 RepID=A5ILG2_THEP1|nr:hypothetical protein [Thermotoga petrophila]ABQ47035.1 hypothetical protein Tpet_1017 [Thermotoga petrophila RKU-1]ADA67172.1 conserved hypothetical protein [Thermotoga petrophila RKU-10]